MFPGCFRGVSEVFPGCLRVCFRGVSGVFPGCFRGVSGVFPGVFPGCFRGVSGVFPMCFRVCFRTQHAASSRHSTTPGHEATTVRHSTTPRPRHTGCRPPSSLPSNNTDRQSDGRPVHAASSPVHWTGRPAPPNAPSSPVGRTRRDGAGRPVRRRPPNGRRGVRHSAPGRPAATAPGALDGASTPRPHR